MQRGFDLNCDLDNSDDEQPEDALGDSKNKLDFPSDPQANLGYPGGSHLHAVEVNLDPGGEDSASEGDNIEATLEAELEEFEECQPDAEAEKRDDGLGSDDGSDYNAVEVEDVKGDREEAVTSEIAPASFAEEIRQEDHVLPSSATSKHLIVRKRPAGQSRVVTGSSAAGPGTWGTSLEGKIGGASVKDVADHYSQRENQRKDVRESSPIIHLKKLNNWIKSVLIRRYTKEGDAVLDFACGKGGDLIKWDFAKIGFYLGVDVAKGSIYDAAARYNGESVGDSGLSRRLSFPAKLVCSDCYGYPLYRDLAEFGPFDVCSCQFALHYSFQSEERARLALRNVSELLAPGGYFIGTIPDANVIVRKLRSTPGLKFGNLVYSIKFDEQFASKNFSKGNPFGIEYLFNLEDAVACPEWLIPFPTLQALAEEFGLELVEKRNFHDFIHHYVANEEFAQIMRRVVGRMWHTTVTRDEWDAAYLYCAFVFRKGGEKPKQEKRKRVAERPARIDSDDILFL